VKNREENNQRFNQKSFIRNVEINVLYAERILILKRTRGGVN